MLVDGEELALDTWLRKMVQRIRFAFATNERYPCTKESYSDLLEHPVSNETKYRESVTNASVLYPFMALISALLRDDKLFADLASLQSETLKYSNFQLWFPDDATEDNLYTNHDLHGVSLCDISLQGGGQNSSSSFRQNASILPNSGSCLASSKVGGSWFSLLVDITACLFPCISSRGLRRRSKAG